VRRAAAILLLVVAGLAALAACSRGPDAEGKRRLFSRERARDASPPAATSFDLDRPGAALDQDADAVARALGSFEWTAAVEWTVSRGGEEAQRVRAVERHRVVQAATGEFAVSAQIDPGLGPGSETGRDLVWTGGMTYGRAKYAPYRERPTDRGRDARRHRDESFGIAGAVARLYGEALAISPAEDLTVLGRPAKRFLLSLAEDAAPPAPAARPEGASDPDAETGRRRAFLDGRIPAAADGELVLDAATGAPLRVRLRGAFGARGEPQVRTTIELLAQVRSLGAEVPAVAAPAQALPDARKASGVAGALDASGLRKRGEDREPARAEPPDDDTTE
jgi:hypothetical protein